MILVPHGSAHAPEMHVLVWAVPVVHCGDGIRSICPHKQEQSPFVFIFTKGHSSFSNFLQHVAQAHLKIEFVSVPLWFIDFHKSLFCNSREMIVVWLLLVKWDTLIGMLICSWQAGVVLLNNQILLLTFRFCPSDPDSTDACSYTSDVLLCISLCAVGILVFCRVLFTWKNILMRKNVKYFLRCLIKEGLTKWLKWTLLLPYTRVSEVRRSKCFSTKLFSISLILDPKSTMSNIAFF